jgi:sugar-specific transcriptional regulator TrmB
MRQQHSSTNKFNPVSPKELMAGSFQMIMADSVEVMEYYYRGKIQEQEQSLAQLNILEHAREIASLCKDIVRTKQVLQNIIIKKGGSHSIYPSVK